MSSFYGTNLVGELISILDKGGISHNELGVGLDVGDVSGLFYRIRFEHGGRVEIFPDEILLFLGEQYIMYAWTAANGVVEDVNRAVDIINRGKKPGFNGVGTVVEKKEDPVCQEGNAPGSSIKEQFLALGEKAIKKIDFGKVADAEWEICSDSPERMFSWARGSIEGAVSKVVAGVTGGEEAEFAFGCLDAKASRKHGRLRIELNHRRTKQYVEVEEDEHA
jgi:hypothetical protein